MAFSSLTVLVTPNGTSTIGGSYYYRYDIQVNATTASSVDLKSEVYYEDPFTCTQVDGFYPSDNIDSVPVNNFTPALIETSPVTTGTSFSYTHNIYIAQSAFIKVKIYNGSSYKIYTKHLVPSGLEWAFPASTQFGFTNTIDIPAERYLYHPTIKDPGGYYRPNASTALTLQRAYCGSSLNPYTGQAMYYNGTLYRPTTHSVYTSGSGSITTPANAYDVNSLNEARLSSGVPVGGYSEIVFGPFSSTTKVVSGYILIKTDPSIASFVAKGADYSTDNGATWTNSNFLSAPNSVLSIPDNTNISNYVPASCKTSSSTADYLWYVKKFTSIDLATFKIKVYKAWDASNVQIKLFDVLFLQNPLTFTDTITGTPTPVISSFSSSPSSITSGGSSTLSWNISGATSASIDNGIGAVAVPTGSTSVSPTISTTYVLTANNASGSTTSSTLITVGSGGGSSLYKPDSNSYTVTDVSDPDGFIGNTAMPTPTGLANAYDFTSTGDTTTTWTSSFTLSSRGVLNYFFNFSSSDVVTGNLKIVYKADINTYYQSDIYYSTNSGSSYTSATGGSIVTGSFRTLTIPLTSQVLSQVKIKSQEAHTRYLDPFTSTYVTYQDIIKVYDIWFESLTSSPTITSFYSSPSSIGAGASSTLYWNITGATSASIDNGVGTLSTPSSGSISVTPASSTTYTLTATNAVGSSYGSTGVTVIPAAPPGTNYKPTSNSFSKTGFSSISPTNVNYAYDLSTVNDSTTTWTFNMPAHSNGSVTYNFSFSGSTVVTGTLKINYMSGVYTYGIADIEYSIDGGSTYNSFFLSSNPSAPATNPYAVGDNLDTLVTITMPITGIALSNIKIRSGETAFYGMDMDLGYYVIKQDDVKIYDIWIET